MRPLIVADVVAASSLVVAWARASPSIVGRNVGGLRGLASGESWHRLPGDAVPFVGADEEGGGDRFERGPKKSRRRRSEKGKDGQRGPKKKRGGRKKLAHAKKDAKKANNTPLRDGENMPLRDGLPTQFPAPTAPTAPDAVAVHEIPTFSPSFVDEVQVDDAQTTTTTAGTSPNASPFSSSATMISILSDDTLDADAILPACPSHYSVTAAYAAGDLIEEHSQIYRCRPPPYEAYCSIVAADEGWDDAQKELWRNAWARVGACEPGPSDDDETTVSGSMMATTAGTEAAPATAGTEAAPTTAATAAATTEDQATDPGEATANSTAIPPAAPEETEETVPPSQPEPAAPDLPPCPSAYDPSRADYVAGEAVTVKSHIFRCREDDGYEIYCNTALWDDALLLHDANATEMWHDAWVEAGPCEETQLEWMEEEAEEAEEEEDAAR